MANRRPAVDASDMGTPKKYWTYDDELHRRRLALVRQSRGSVRPVDLAEERLRRLRERARDTRDP